MAAKTVLNLSMVVDDESAHLARMLIEQPGPNARTVLSNLGKRITAYATGIKRSKFVLRIDETALVSEQELLESARPTITITFANITSLVDSMTIGAVTLTWQTAPAASESFVAIGANLAAATTNLVNAINVHTKLVGLVEATGDTATGIVTLTFLGDPRMAHLIALSESGDAVAVSAASFAGDTTNTYVASTGVEDLGID
jgi:hypothetical protein